MWRPIVGIAVVNSSAFVIRNRVVYFSFGAESIEIYLNIVCMELRVSKYPSTARKNCLLNDYDCRKVECATRVNVARKFFHA